jgi:hypothetical protein
VTETARSVWRRFYYPIVHGSMPFPGPGHQMMGLSDGMDSVSFMGALEEKLSETNSSDSSVGDTKNDPNHQHDM